MCKSILKGQNVPGTDGTYHGTDGTCPRDRRDASGCPAKILYVYWFFLSRQYNWESLNGGSQPLSAIWAQSSTIVHFCGLFGPLSKGELSSQNDDNRRQSWTIVDKCLKPAFAKPPFRLSRNKNLRFQIFVVVTFPTKKKKNSVFGRSSSVPPMSPPLKSANVIFIVVSPSLIYGRENQNSPDRGQSKKSDLLNFWGLDRRNLI